MAGLNCGIPSMCGWEIIKSGCDATISISDEYAKRAIRALYFPIKDDERVISGESGAAGLGGLIKCLEVNKFNVLRKHIGINSKSEILFINTEGNTDPESFKSIISRIN